MMVVENPAMSVGITEIPFEIEHPIPLFGPDPDTELGSAGNIKARINPGVTDLGDSINFLVREIYDIENGCDFNFFGKYEFGREGVRHLGKIPIREMVNCIDSNVLNCEDIRTGTIRNKKSKGDLVDIGFTSVYSRRNGEYYPLPTIATLDLSEDVLSPCFVYKDIGKNCQPLLKEDEEDGTIEFMFRPDGGPHSFRFVRIRDGKTERWDEIFENPPAWASYRIGLNGQPIQLGDGSELYILHGVHAANELVKYRYFFGMGVRDPESRRWKLSKRPFLSSDMVNRELGRVAGYCPGELHPFRRVIYNNGHFIRDGEIYLPTNVGDRVTVLLKYQMGDMFDFAEPLISQLL